MKKTTETEKTIKKSTKTISFDEKKDKADRIRAKIAELGEKRAATEEKWKVAGPMEKVALEKTMQQESDQMMLLQRELAETEQAITENLVMPDEDRAQIFAGIQAYINKDQSKRGEVKAQYEEIQAQIRKAEEALKAATQSADLLAMGKAAQEKENAEKALEYGKELLSATEASKTFPDGAIVEEWKKCCEIRRGEWESALNDVRTFASAYKMAVKRFLILYEDMKNIRREMGQFSIELDGAPITFPVVMTPSMSGFEMGAFLKSIEISAKEGEEIGKAFKWGQFI